MPLTKALQLNHRGACLKRGRQRGPVANAGQVDQSQLGGLRWCVSLTLRSGDANRTVVFGKRLARLRRPSTTIPLNVVRA